MKVKEILTQHRRDFTAILECEHCKHEITLMNGYDDDRYHCKVIPKMECEECGKVAADDYQPLKTRHPAGFVI